MNPQASEKAISKNPKDKQDSITAVIPHAPNSPKKEF
jgi:hypothetical protein